MHSTFARLVELNSNVLNQSVGHNIANVLGSIRQLISVKMCNVYRVWKPEDEEMNSVELSLLYCNPDKANNYFEIVLCKTEATRRFIDDIFTNSKHENYLDHTQNGVRYFLVAMDVVKEKYLFQCLTKKCVHRPSSEMKILVEMCANIVHTVLCVRAHQKLSQYDSLTNLLNKRGIKNKSENLVRDLKLHNQNLMAVILLDLDSFKKINDMHGHSKGDQILSTMGKILQKSIRQQNDFAGRFGGDEFIIVLTNTNKTETLKIAERFRFRISRGECGDIIAMVNNYRNLRVTASFGIAFARHGTCFNSVVEMADKALYYSKSLGGNQISVKDLHNQTPIHCAIDLLSS